MVPHGLLRLEPVAETSLTVQIEATLSEPIVSDPAAAPYFHDERDALTALLAIYDVWLAPRVRLDGREIHQSNPEIVRVKACLDSWFRERLDRTCPSPTPTPIDAVAEMRHIATSDLVPAVYEWLADEATWEQLVHYLALEGGPDAEFDDLVALAQIGIEGDPKVALAANYWDELGRGDLRAVHTELHHRLVRALGMPRLSRADQPLAALERTALNGLLATNRCLQGEMLGALGLLEMQAGPRCRAVVRALRRLDAPPDAFPFYEEHARADPRHGKEWLERVVAPLALDPQQARAMVRGARWRSAVNARFFTTAREHCLDRCPPDLARNIA
jgi:hypothetical protein